MGEQPGKRSKMVDTEKGVLQPTGLSTAPILFSFSSKAAQSQLAGQGDSPGAAQEEDFLKTTEGRKL